MAVVSQARIFRAARRGRRGEDVGGLHNAEVVLLKVRSVVVAQDGGQPGRGTPPALGQ